MLKSFLFFFFISATFANDRAGELWVHYDGFLHYPHTAITQFGISKVDTKRKISTRWSQPNRKDRNPLNLISGGFEVIGIDLSHNNQLKIISRYAQNDRKYYDEKMKFVYDVFEKQIQRRDIFQPDFIEILKREDENLNLARMYSMEYKQIKEEVFEGKTVGVVAIYDSRDFKHLPKSKLPFQHKYPHLSNLEPGLEIRRLAISQKSNLNLDIVLSDIHYNLRALNEGDLPLYAHTDRMGKNLFTRKTSFQVVENAQLRDGEFLLMTTANEFRAFITPHLPPLPTKSKSCRNSFLKPVIQALFPNKSK